MTVINDNHGERIENLVESMSIVSGNSKSNNTSAVNDDSLLFGHSDDEAKKKTKTTTSSDDENKPVTDSMAGGGAGSSLQQLATKNRSSTHPDVSSDKPSENSRAESIQGLEAAKLEKLAHIEKKSVGF